MIGSTTEGQVFYDILGGSGGFSNYRLIMRILGVTIWLIGYTGILIKSPRPSKKGWRLRPLKEQKGN